MTKKTDDLFRTTTDVRDEYVTKWKSYVDALNTLGFCSDRVASDRIYAIIDELHGLIETVADSKNFTN